MDTQHTVRGLVLSILLILAASAAAEAPAYLWGKHFGEDNANQIGFDLAIDSQGSVILAGSFRGSLDFGGGPIVSNGDEDFFIAKFDALGNHLWSRGFGDAQQQICYSIAVGPDDTIVMAGWNFGSIDLGGGAVASAGMADIWIAKLDADGSHIWSHGFGGIGSQLGYGVAVGPAGEVYLAGSFIGELDFGLSPLDNTSDSQDAYLVKFNADGEPEWQKWFESSSDADLTAIALTDDGRDIYLAGDFGGTLQMGSPPLVSAGGRDIFTARFDAEGQPIWSQCFGDPENQDCGGICIDALGNLILTGYFESSVHFGGEPLISNGGIDVCLASFDPNGDHAWSSSFGDGEAEFSFDISADALGNIVMTGYFKGSIEFGGGGLVSAGHYDIYVAGFDTSGMHTWSASYGEDQIDKGFGVAAGANGEFLITGTFSIMADFGGGPIGNGTHQDVFLVKYRHDLTATPPDIAQALPALFAYPNPFNPSTAIAFDIPATGEVRLSIIGSDGRRLRSLYSGELEAGRHNLRWDGRDADGGRLASGVYYLHLETSAGSAAHKVVLLK